MKYKKAIDKCLKCGKLTDNNTGERVEIRDLNKYTYVNNWICDKCIKKHKGMINL